MLAIGTCKGAGREFTLPLTGLIGPVLVTVDARGVDSLIFSLGKKLSLDYICYPFFYLPSLCALPLCQDQGPTYPAWRKHVSSWLSPTCIWWKVHNIKWKRGQLPPFLLACVERRAHPSVVIVSRPGNAHFYFTVFPILNWETNSCCQLGFPLVKE